MKNKQQTAASRRIAFSYFVDYASPATERPNNIVVLGDRREEGRWTVSHRRPIKDNNDKQIGDASYLAHVYRVDLADDKKSGLMYADFSAHHEFKKDGKDYDIFYKGGVKFALGIRGPQLEVDPLFPINHIQKVDPECVAATEIFENKIKINSGKNIAVLKRNNKNITNYRVAAFALR
jgi:hypothetical protein